MCCGCRYLDAEFLPANPIRQLGCPAVGLAWPPSPEMSQKKVCRGGSFTPSRTICEICALNLGKWPEL